MNWQILNGDVVDALKLFPDDHFHGVLTDPPYGLEFMGKDWDRVVPGVDVWREVLRVMRPGSYILAFGGTRTFHRLAINLEDAGFTLRDTLAWMYGSGFPKSMAIDKAIDKKLGAARPVVGSKRTNVGIQGGNFSAGSATAEIDVTAPGSEEAAIWEGYGTAIKPAWEPVILAQKPLAGTFAENAMIWGVGGLAIDACRIAVDPDDDIHAKNPNTRGGFGHAGASVYGDSKGAPAYDPAAGRWPANVVLDEVAAAVLDEQTGERKSGKPGTRRVTVNNSAAYGQESREPGPMVGYGDTGGASRFFYCAKPTRAEADAGLGALEDRTMNRLNPGGLSDDPRWAPREVKNHHPTKKPIRLNAWLARLILPPQQAEMRRILVPFAGSGSEVMGALSAGWDEAIGIELAPDFCQVARARLKHHAGTEESTWA